MMDKTSEISNAVTEFRRKRGLSVVELAGKTGVTRQTIYSIESGDFVPNTAVSLKLARALDTSVEELFRLPADAGESGTETQQARLLTQGGRSLRSGQPVQLCPVAKEVIAVPFSRDEWIFPGSDGFLTGETRRSSGLASVELVRSSQSLENRLLIAGCDPALPVLASHAEAKGVKLVLAHRNSSQALQLLKQRRVHIAGMHLRDRATGEFNLPIVEAAFPKKGAAVMSYSIWEEGIITQHGNPKEIRNVEDFGRRDVRMVNREAGAGSRKLLDEELRRLKLRASAIRGYDAEAQGHVPAARRVLQGEADCCIGTRAVAKLLGLDFTPLVRERYDLVLWRKDLEDGRVQQFLDTLRQASLRRELEVLCAYDARDSGKRLM